MPLHRPGTGHAQAFSAIGHGMIIFTQKSGLTRPQGSGRTRPVLQEPAVIAHRRESHAAVSHRDPCLTSDLSLTDRSEDSKDAKTQQAGTTTRVAAHGLTDRLAYRTAYRWWWRTGVMVLITRSIVRRWWRRIVSAISAGHSRQTECCGDCKRKSQG